MAKIIPAILEQSFNGLQKKLDLLIGLTDFVQIDICDGIFTSEATWPFVTPPQIDKSVNYEGHFQSMVAQQSEMLDWSNFDFEIDLMVTDVKRFLPDLMSIGPASIVFHLAAFKDFNSEIYDLQKIIPHIVEVGVAVNPDANLSVIFPLIEDKTISFVQCMGIAKVGVQGTHFDEAVFKKTISHITTLRQKYPELPISVDGEVSLENAKQLVEAGATRLISGSAIFSAENISQRIAEFNAVIQ